MKTFTYTLSDEDYARHKENALIVISETYRSFLKKFQLEDNTSSENKFMKVMIQNPIEKTLNHWQDLRNNIALRAQRQPSGLS